MIIEERILNDNSCSPYVDKGRKAYSTLCKDFVDRETYSGIGGEIMKIEIEIKLVNNVQGK